MLTQSQIAAIERILAKGDRVELIPVADNKVKALRIRREQIKEKLNN